MMKVFLMAILLLAGCVTRVEHKPVTLGKPSKPELPLVQGQALACLTDASYEALVKRDALLKEYAKKLEAVIDQNNEAAK